MEYARVLSTHPRDHEPVLALAADHLTAEQGVEEVYVHVVGDRGLQV